MRIPDHWKHLYRPEEVPLPNGVPNPDLQRRVQAEIVDRDFNGDPTNADSSHIDYRKVPTGEAETEGEIRQYIAEYYGMIANVDWNIGRLLDWLDSAGVADDTCVFFFSDHGDMLGQHGLYCGNKRVAYRGAMHVPVIARWPGQIEPNTVSDALIDFSIDAMPTLLDLAGAPIPPGLFGKSLWQILSGGSTQEHDAVFYQLMLQSQGLEGDIHPRALRGYRSKDWLYVRDKEGPRWLFDLRADPDEEHNLACDDSHSDTLNNLDAWVLNRMRDSGDNWDQEHEFPPPDFVSHKDAAEEHRNLLRQAIVETLPRSSNGI